MRIVAYKVVYGPVREMNALINERLSEGWQPYGSPTFVVLKAHACVMQVMVKYEKQEQ